MVKPERTKVPQITDKNDAEWATMTAATAVGHYQDGYWNPVVRKYCYELVQRLISDHRLDVIYPQIGDKKRHLIEAKVMDPITGAIDLTTVFEGIRIAYGYSDIET